jgi:uracil-DNA glycosylase family 4
MIEDNMDRLTLIRELGLGPVWAQRRASESAASVPMPAATPRCVFVGEAEIGPAQSPEAVLLANMMKGLALPMNPQPTYLTAANRASVLTADQAPPRLIVALGEAAVCALLGTALTKDAARSQSLHWQGVPVLVCEHPADLLREPQRKAQAWQDLLAVRKALAATS